MEIFRDANGDGDLDDTNEDNEPESEPIGSSAQGGTANETTTIGPDPTPGKYFARVVNYAGAEPYDFKVTFKGPEEFKAGTTESWTLTCEVGGNVRATRQVEIARGQSRAIDFGSACPAPPPGSSGNGGAGNGSGNGARVCASISGGIGAKRVGRVPLARKRAFQRRLLRRVRRLRSRTGVDSYCQAGGGILRIGYPTALLNRFLTPPQRRRVRGKAILAISNNRRLRLRGIGVGTSTTELARLLRGELRFKVGKNVWFVAAGSSSRLLFRTRSGRVQELGLANKRLTSTRRGTLRFLRALL